MLKTLGFLATARADDRVKSLNRDLEKGIYSLDTTAMLSEIEKMHIGRSIRSATSKQIMRQAQKSLIDGGLQNQAYRSRCVEIKMQCYRASTNLFERSEQVERYLQVQYASKLKAEYKTQGDRSQAINLVLSKAIKVQKSLDLVIEIADIIVDDLDKAAYTLLGITKALELSMQKERFV